MLTIFLDKTSKKPLYEQLYREIRQKIEEGLLFSGEKLPSKRKLADHLKISQITVENAYSQLVAEGYLKTIPKSGFFVEETLKTPSKNLTERADLGHFSPKNTTFYRYDFKTNVVDSNLFPYSLWGKLERMVLSEPSADLLNYTDPQGSFSLREAIAGYLEAYRGVHADPESIIVGAGSEYLLGLVVQLIGRNRIVALENPGYGKIARVFQSQDVSIIPISLDDQGLCVTDLEKTPASVVHVTPSHQFPSGVIMPFGRRMALLNWANSGNNRFILEDDYDSEFRFFGMPIPALQGLDKSEKVIYFNSFSKSLAPTLRISFMVLPPMLLKKYREKLTFYASSVPNFIQNTLTLFLKGGYFERHLNRMRIAYRERRDALISAILKSPLKTFCTVLNPDAGLHFLLQVNNGMEEEELVISARGHEVNLTGLNEYFIYPTLKRGKPTLVIGYSGFNSADIPKAVSQLVMAWTGEKENLNDKIGKK
jgi:GntR family transcriptional regulator/MocR family aminotransferase